ncbi:MAG: glycosyltransferase family 4 protein [Anaerolineales bacterium]|nr:glycosyltransferase family 4 protein [Anaerolineales bacterium]
MKVLFLLTQDLESPGGLGRYFPLARELARLGHQVSISALHADFHSLKERCFIRDDVKVRYVSQMHVSKRGNYKRYFSPFQLMGIVGSATIKLTGSALNTPADIIHVGKPHPMNGIAGLIARRKPDRKLFVDCDDYEAASGHFKYSWQKSIISNSERQLPRRADFVTTNTQFMRSKLVSWGIDPSKIIQLPNGIDRQRFANPEPEQVETLRTRLGLGGKKVIAFIGSLSLVSHPINLLLEAFEIIRSQISDGHLLIVGGGESYDELRVQAERLDLKDDVSFTGRVPPDQLVNYYHLSHVTVDPVYDNEAARGRLPMKLFESWACGVPFITADVGDRRQYLANPPAGLLTRPGDPAALADAILRLLADSDLANQISRTGLRLVEDYYWDQLVKNLEAGYLRSLEN